jgi:SAM-dependent methyltransferase
MEILIGAKMQFPNDIVMNEDELIRDVSPNDEMYAGDKDDVNWYWFVGRSAIECISHCMAAAGKRARDVKRILDFPCGHGRVTRYLKLAFPHAEITACDLLHDGVDFCASRFGAVPLYSHNDPTRIGLQDRAYDLIWVGSLFTHFAGARWNSFLRLFASSLSEDGLLVFSAHGLLIYYRIKGIDRSYNYGLPRWRDPLVCHSYERKGMGYANYSGSEDFGISLSNPAWVCDQIRRIPELTMVYFSASSWHKYHDVYACRRLADNQIVPPTSSSAYWKSRARDLTPRKLIQLAKTLGFGGGHR